MEIHHFWNKETNQVSLSYPFTNGTDEGNIQAVYKIVEHSFITDQRVTPDDLNELKHFFESKQNKLKTVDKQFTENTKFVKEIDEVMS